MNEAAQVALFAVLFIGPGIYLGIRFRDWWWFWFFMAVLVLVGVFELLASATTGSTISQHLWAISKTHPGEAWAVLAVWTCAWFGLMWHLAIKMIRRKK